jgi:DnaA family protein
LYGPAGGGKSHLLALAASRGAEVGDKLETLVEEEQERLFHAFNANVPVVVASGLPVAQLTNLLPDLKSRLLTGIQVEVSPPDDEDLRVMLKHWAEVMQLSLPDAVVDYVLVRAGRSTHELAALMARLDALSLEQKRAVTVPLARAVLEEG